MKDTEFILERIFIDWGVSSYAFDAHNHILCKATQYSKAETDTLEQDESIIFKLRNTWQQQKTPVVLMEDETVYYLGFDDHKGVFYAIGPAVLEQLSTLKLSAYKKKHGIKMAFYQIPLLPILKSLNSLALFYYLITDIKLSENEIIEGDIPGLYVSERDMAGYKINTIINEIDRRPYSDDRDFTNAVYNGDTDFFKKPEVQQFTKNSGVMAKKTIKQSEYMAVSGITVATRTAIHAGLKPIEAYTLSDLYLQKLELSTSALENQAIAGAAVLDFTERVKSIRQQSKSVDYIEGCKDFITRNYHHPIRVSEIAGKLNINRTYLSRKFTEQTGMTIRGYISKVRLEAAANMLRYSDVSISDIAEYLCYNSQSYFGEHFKTYYHMTPLEFRRKNKVIDFGS